MPKREEETDADGYMFSVKITLKNKPLPFWTGNDGRAGKETKKH